MSELRMPRLAGRGNSATVKILSIGIMVLAFLVPLSMISSLVGEREQRRDQAVAAVASTAGGSPVVAGPILNVPYLAQSTGADGKAISVRRVAHFLPGSVTISGRMNPQRRARGIYEAILFTVDLSLSARFGSPDFSALHADAERILWNESYVSVELSDMRVLRDEPNTTWNGRRYYATGATASVGIFNSETRVYLGAAGNQLSRSPDTPGPSAGPLPDGAGSQLEMQIGLGGAQGISFLPLGGTTTVELSSSWSTPGFDGFALPVTRSIDANGFTARWHLLALNRNFPQSFLDAEIDPRLIRATDFGVSLIKPVDTYQRVTRAVKYGVLFVLLPFVALFLFEVHAKLRIHPMQYLLIGFAVSVFYLLLLSLSEQLPFAAAFWISAGATTLLVTTYAFFVLATWKRGFALLPVLGTLYLFLYVVIQSEDYALVIGSIGLFLIVATIMTLTRGVDWYGLRPRGEGAGTPTAVHSESPAN